MMIQIFREKLNKSGKNYYQHFSECGLYLKQVSYTQCSKLFSNNLIISRFELYLYRYYGRISNITTDLFHRDVM